MQAVADQPFTSTLIDPAGDTSFLGARVEVPVTREIVSFWQEAVLDGAVWSVELDAPVDPGDYLLVWRTGDPEPPAFETFLPLTVSASVLASGGIVFPVVDEGEVRPTLEEVANLANTRTASGGGGELGEFTEDSNPTATQVEGAIDQAVEAALSQLPLRFSVDHYERVRHVVTLYTLILLEGSFFREKIDSGSVDLWRNLFTSSMAGLQGRIQEELKQARILGRMEPRATDTGVIA